MKTKDTISLFLALLFAANVFARAPKRIDFTVSGYPGTTTLTNFPVLVRLSETAVKGFRYASCAPSGADLSFALPDGTDLSREIDTWAPDGESLVWVRLPECKNGVRFHAYFGDKSVTSQPPCQTNGAVWKPSGYIGVWHMNELDAKDSTGLGNDGHLEGNVESPDGRIVPGQVGLAQNFDGNLRVDCGHMLDTSYGKGMTIEGWTRLTDASNRRAMIGQDGCFTLKFSNGSYLFTTPGKSDHNLNAQIPLDAWGHVAFTFAPTQENGAKAYLDGVLKVQAKASDIATSTTATLLLGGNQWKENFKGDLDELRISKAIQFPDWLLGCHETMARDDFLTSGGIVMGNNSLEISTSPSLPLPGAEPPIGILDHVLPGTTIDCSLPNGIIDIAEGVRAVCSG